MLATFSSRSRDRRAFVTAPRAGCVILAPVRRLLLLFLATLSIRCTPAPDASTPPAPAASAPPEPRAPVVVTLVVDQLAAWIVADRLPTLPADGGFARLRREGTYVVEARHPHAVTDTAPGHATLYTGATLRDSGIFANERFDPGARAAVSILRDPATREVDEDGPTSAASSSLAALRVDTLADRLRASRPDAYIVSLSLKDRGAIFAGGRRPDASLWYSLARDAFVTSTAFSPSFPAWARAHGSRAAIESARRAPWTLLDPRWIEAHARTPDAQRGEGDLGGFGVTFPHHFERAKSPPLAFRASPRGDEALLALALAALDARPAAAGRAPTLLAISLSSHDYVLHVFGPDSWEALDELRRLDAALGRFFHALDDRFGPSGWSALLAADHGASPLPETMDVPGARPWCAPGAIDRFQRPCVRGARIDPDKLAVELAAAAREAVGPGDWVLAASDPYVHLSDAARALPADKRDDLVRALVRRALAHPEIERVVDVRSVPSSCPPLSDESVDALICRSRPAGAGGDLYVVIRAGSLFDPTYTPGAGGNHGTPNLYDRSVPIFARAPGRVPAGRVIDAPGEVAIFTRTAASLLGIAPPSAAIAGGDLTGR